MRRVHVGRSHCKQNVLRRRTERTRHLRYRPLDRTVRVRGLCVFVCQQVHSTTYYDSARHFQRYYGPFGRDIARVYYIDDFLLDYQSSARLVRTKPARPRLPERAQVRRVPSEYVFSFGRSRRRDGRHERNQCVGHARVWHVLLRCARSRARRTRPTCRSRSSRRRTEP